MKTKVLDDARTQEFWERVKGYSVPSKALTLAEYNALTEEEKQANIQYIITDDNSSGGATMEQVNEAISAVNAIKQDKLVGTSGQVVGFDAAGNAVAQNIKDKEEIYSTEEVRIGTWIDGRPLYRKTFSTATPAESNGLFNVASIGDLNISDVIMIFGMFESRNGGKMPIPIYYSVNNSCVFIQIYEQNIQCMVNNNNLTERPLFITVEYTKTTDPATVSQSTNFLLSSINSINISQASSAKSELTSIKSTEQGEVM